MLTGDLIEAYHRNYLKIEDLNKWSISLLESGYEGEAVITAASCPDLSWQEVPVYFKKILKELNITDDLDHDIEKLKERIFLEEYKLGLRSGGALLHKVDSLRREIGFYDRIGLTIIGDEYTGTDKSGYHTLDRKLYGEKLEREIRYQLIMAGKI